MLIAPSPWPPCGTPMVLVRPTPPPAWAFRH